MYSYTYWNWILYGKAGIDETGMGSEVIIAFLYYFNKLVGVLLTVFSQ